MVLETSLSILAELINDPIDSKEQIEQLTNRRVGLQQSLDDASVSFCPALQHIIELSVYNRQALPSRVLILIIFKEALKNPNIYMIGVYGMGGVGKNVVVVAVSQTAYLRRIQTEIPVLLA